MNYFFCHLCRCYFVWSHQISALLVFLHNFTKYNLEIVVVLFSSLPDISLYSWQYISFQLHLLRVAIHLNNGLLTKSWRNQEVEIESCPDYLRALQYSNNLPNFLHLLNHSVSKTKYASCVCNRIVPVICAHCCLAFRRVTCRFWWKRIIDGWFIFQILS